MKSLPELILIRHPETVWEGAVKNPEDHGYEKKLLGRSDIPLSEKGLREAKQIALWVKGLKPTHIVTSPLFRARQLADEISLATGVPTMVLPGLAEIDFGKAEGKTFRQFARLAPRAYRQYVKESDDLAFPGGESFKDFAERVSESLRRISELKGRIVIVTHGGVIRTAVPVFLGATRALFWRLMYGHGAVAWLTPIGEKYLLSEFNSRPWQK